MIARLFALLCLCVLLPLADGHAQARQPLTVPGKQSLYQRVITRPGAELARQPGAAGQPVPGFSVFYVYARQGNAIEVGEAADGRIAGFIPADKAIDWRHTMIAAFTNPAGREPAMFLRDETVARDAWNAPDRAARGAAFRRQAMSGQPGEVVALEPEAWVDISRQFYLLPILSATRLDPTPGEPATMLSVISAPAQPTPPPPAADALRNFKGAVVFVVDTSISMQPYIDRTKQVIERVVARIGDTVVRDNFRFGLVTFRDFVTGREPGDYVVRVVSPPSLSDPPDAILSRMAPVAEARSSNDDFDEDPLAGIKAAAELDWTPFAGRYIVLITDAGGREPPDPKSATGLSMEDANTFVRETAKAALYAIHLRTPEGRTNHAKAERQYRQLTQFPGTAPLYFPVPEGRVNDFGEIVDQLTDAILQQVANAVGRPIAGLRPGGHGQAQQRLAEQTQIVGNAMRLAYLGRANETAAPDVRHSVVMDEDWTDPSPARRPLEVRVLLTRNQLSDLAATVGAIVESGNAGRLAPETMFQRLRGAMAAVTRDPRRIREFQRLSGAFGEFLEDLPYQSQIMEITEDQWLNMGAGERRTILNALSSKLRLYEEFARQPSLWVSLDRERNPGEQMYPVPLSALP
ncbi:MAG: VWA domain-containing protein [Acetobacteraceae bacterium]|nr:VWA domain-containing protein [Acetobacteraceae bacterium]